MQANNKSMTAKRSVLFASIIYALTQSGGVVLAASAEAPPSGNIFSKLFSKSAGTSIKHKPVAYITPDKRIRLEASVEDSKGISLVRVYFKADNQADYLFVPMETTTAGSYAAILPGMAKGAKSLDYLFLAVNNDNQVVKTQVFSVKQKEDKDAPSWQMVKSEGDIQVWTELGKAPSVAESFSDSIAMNAVESGGRFGVVAGLYEGSTSAAASGTAGSATNAGTIAASAGGLSTAAIVGAAVVGGAAAAGGGGGGGGTAAPTPTPTPTTNPFVGTTWSGTMNLTSPGLTSVSCSWAGTVNSQGALVLSAFACNGISYLPYFVGGTFIQIPANGNLSTSFNQGGVSCTLNGTVTLSPKAVDETLSCTVSAAVTGTAPLSVTAITTGH